MDDDPVTRRDALVETLLDFSSKKHLGDRMPADDTYQLSEPAVEEEKDQELDLNCPEVGPNHLVEQMAVCRA